MDDMWVDLNVAPAAPLKRGKGGLTFCMKWWAENLKSPRVILMMLIFLSRLASNFSLVASNFEGSGGKSFQYGKSRTDLGTTEKANPLTTSRGNVPPPLEPPPHVLTSIGRNRRTSLAVLRRKLNLHRR